MKTTIVSVLFALIVALVSAAEPAATKPAAPSKPPAKKPVYELPKTGVNQPRPAGGWINAEAVGIRFVLKFYDKDRKPVPPNVDRGFARFNYAAKNDKKAVLSVEGLTLVTPATLRPPHNFLVILTLFAGESTEPTETYNFKYP